MTLIKTSVLTAISTIIKVIAGFVINKVIALYIGPSGLAVVGQLQSFMSIVTTFSNGAITSGIVKYTAEYQTIEQKQKIFSSSITISLVCSFFVSIFLFGFSEYLSELILKDAQYSSVLGVLGTPKCNQPVQFVGDGNILFGKNVNFGYFPSPYFYNSCIYIEARNKILQNLFT